MPRPLTHDLFISLLKDLHAELERIEITALKEGTFFAKLVLLQNEKKQIIDARPSDAMGIAVRKKCPIFIAEAVVDEAGIPLSSITEQTVENPEEHTAEEQSPEAPQVSTVAESGEEKPERSGEKKRLEEELEKAVSEEDYEEAAKIRDKLKEFDDENTD